jgi:hypothetical protein
MNPCIRDLMAQALATAGADLTTGRGKVVLKSTVASSPYWVGRT